MKGTMKIDPDNNHHLVKLLILETLPGAPGPIVSAVWTLTCFLIQSDSFQLVNDRQFMQNPEGCPT